MLFFSVLCLVGIVMGGSWVFDRSGALGSLVSSASGSLIDRYSTLPEQEPWIAHSDLAREYMQSGVIDHQPHLIQAQQSVLSDLLWIRNIQQVGRYVLRDDTPGLFGMMENLTSLSPAWSFPYAFIQYVGPQQPPQGEEANKSIRATWNQTVALGEDGIRMTCDPDLVAKIMTLSDKEFVTIINQPTKEPYLSLREPCENYLLPHILGFNYFYYIEDLEKAIGYYKIAAFHQEAPLVTATMPALLRSRLGSHLISAQLRFDRAMALQGQSGDAVIQEQYERALSKAIYELQLHLLDQAMEKTNSCDHQYTCLVQSGDLRRVIRSLVDQCTTDATLSEQIQCILLQQGVETHAISLNGVLINPTASSLTEAWEYSSNRGWRTR